MQTEIKIEAVLPLLPAQQGLLVDSLAGESDVYKQQICVEIVSSITTATLKANILKVLEQHEMLRTIFDWSDEEPLRIVVSGIEPSLAEFTLDSERLLSTVLAQEKALLKPINERPPIRFAIIKDGHTQLLAITYHHILLDGPSVDMLIRQIIIAENLPSSPANAYTDWFASTIGSDEQNIWKSSLAEINDQDGTLTQPQEKPEGNKYIEVLEPQIYSRVIDKAKELRVTPAVYVQSLWSVWERAYFAKDSLLYGLVVSTRTPNLTDNLIGPYISTIPWVVTGTVTDFDTSVRQTNDRILEMQTAKHLALGDIVKHTSPLAMSFDSILTITTRPIQDTSLYKVVATSEDTGYPLSVDIEISTNIAISFSTSLANMEDAIKSFRLFFETQTGSTQLTKVTGTYVGPVSSSDAASPHIETPVLLRYASEVLDVEVGEIYPSSNLLMIGGDSIAALRLKVQLQAAGFRVSVGDILKAHSFSDLSHKVLIEDQFATDTAEIAPSDRKSLEDRYGTILEDISYTPPAARVITEKYRHNFGQDYHEQTAFSLSGVLDERAFTDAVVLLGQELPTLRLVYPEQYPDLQVLVKDPRIQVTFKDVDTTTFEAFTEFSSNSDWNELYDLENGPLLKIVAAQPNTANTYLFMSFSALVVDGWSFSIMLERLFTVYAALLEGIDPLGEADHYFEYSKQTTLPTPSSTNALQHPDNYAHTVTGEDFVIEKRLTKSITKKSSALNITPNNILLSTLGEVLSTNGFSGIEIYENGRDDARYLSSIGPYSYLSHKELSSEIMQKAYYVFENYPKESENRLKQGQVQGFHEQGNWRRDLLPPGVNLGFLFELTGDTISLRILTRNPAINQGIYWEKLLAMLERNQP